MGTFYKYAERNTDAYVDWNVIGKTLSDNLLAENKSREDQKAELDRQSRELGTKLDSPELGQYQPANEFMLKYASQAQQARLMQDKLLKSGRLSLKDYTVMRQNLSDGTTQLTELQKLIQGVAKSRMEGIKSGKLQAMNTYNMKSVESFGDFSTSEAIINPNNGTVNVSKKVFNKETGQWELTNDAQSVAVMRSKIMTEVPTFLVEDAMNAAKKSMGKVATDVYLAAKTTGAGTIKSLIGPGVANKDPKIKSVIDNFNKAVDGQVNSWLTNPYNISSVLTENLGGKYNDESFTSSREEAENDPTKILVKIDPVTSINTLDTSGPNYEAQRQEAINWTKDQYLSKFDNEIKYQTTAQTQQLRPPSETESRNAWDLNQTKGFTNMMSKLWGGNQQDLDAATQYFRDIPVPDGAPTITKINRNPDGVTVYYSDGTNKPLKFRDENKKPIPQSVWIQSSSPLLVNGLSVDEALKNGGYNPGYTFNNTGISTSSVGKSATPPTSQQKFVTHINNTLNTSMIGTDTEETAANMTKRLENLGYTATAQGDNIILKNENGEKSPILNFAGDAYNSMKKLKQWIHAHPNGKEAKDIATYYKKLEDAGIFGNGKGELDN